MKEMKQIIMKTNNRSYRNVINDTVIRLDRLACNPEVATDEMMNDYSISYLLTKCARSSHEDCKFDVGNVRYGKFNDRVYSFDLKLKIEDADIVIRVSDVKGKSRGQLFMGGFFCRSLHCANGAYTEIIDQLYDCAAGVKVAA